MKISKGHLSLFICAILFAILPTFTRVCSYSFSIQTIMVLRSLLLFASISVYFFLTKTKPKLKYSSIRFGILLGLVIGLDELFISYSIVNTTIFQAIASLYFGMILGNFISSVLLKEKIRINQIFAAILILVALTIMLNTNKIEILSVFLAFTSGLIETVRGLINKKVEGENTLHVMFYQFIGMVIVTTLAFFISNKNPVTKIHSSSILALIAFTAGFFLLSKLIIFGYQNSTMVSAAFVLIIEIPLSIFFGWLFFHEQISGPNFLVIILIMVGSIISEIRLKPRKLNS